MEAPGPSRDPSSVDVMSIAELVARWMNPKDDVWQLSLVQRGLVWSDLQVQLLLDSLLLGFPIGSLLICAVRHGGSVLVQEGGRRVRREAPEGTWQLLDGQQRLNALARLFAAPASLGDQRVLVRLDVLRESREVVLGRSAQEKELKYIAMRAPEHPPDPRWPWFDVSRIYGARAALPSIEALEEATPSTLFSWAEQIDPECKRTRWEEAEKEAQEVAADRLRRLFRAWASRSVPVMKLLLEGPSDVLQVFARVNRTGTAVAGDDIFFAGVKTVWPDAEEHVERVRENAPQIRRTATLRLLARAAASELGKDDITPLDVNRLRGDAGKHLVERMTELASPEKHVLVERMRQVSDAAIGSSGLGYALRDVHHSLWDHTFAWAAARRTWPPADEELHALWGYLVGATAFRYSQVFDAPFDRLAFRSAVKAGREDRPFPVQEIAAQCKAAWAGLRKGRQVIARVDSDDERRRFVNDNWSLVLHTVQRIPFRLPPERRFDWEHLYPQAKIDRMRWKGPDDRSRLQRYEGSGDLYRTGNLFVLDESLNRQAQDKWPDEKLGLYRGKGHWPEELFLSPTEEQDLLAACACFRANDVPAGMKRFRAYVRARELRIFEVIRARFATAFTFAPDPVSVSSVHSPP